MAREPISPELVLIDPELARPPDELETEMIDSPNSLDAEPKPSIETLMFNAGLIDADQLGELVRDAVLAQRPVAALALERSLVTPQALDTLLAQTRAAEQPAPAQPAPEQPAPVEQAAPVLLQPESDPEPEPPLPPAAEQPAPALSIPPVHAQPSPAVAAAVAVDAAVEPRLQPEPQPEPAIALAPEPVAEPTPLHAVAPVDEGAPSFEILVRLTNGESVRAGDAASRDAAEQLGRSTADRFRDGAEWPLVGGRFLRPDLVVSVDVVRRLED